MRAALAIAVALASTAGAAAAPVEVRAHRGVGGVVAAGGIDVVELEVQSGADVAAPVELVIDGRTHRVDLAARGSAVVTLARRVAPGVTDLPAIAVRRERAAVAEIPAARVLHRPVVVVTDDAAALLPRVDGWRRRAGLGEPVVIGPDELPARWEALVGVGALVLDRPAAALDGAAARQVARYLAAGGQVCRWSGSDDAPVCAAAAAVAVPRTREPASIGGALRGLGWIALIVAVALAGVATRRRGRGVAVVLGLGCAGLAPFVRWPDDGARRVRGVRAPAGGGEDWVAAEVGAGELGGTGVLGGDLWIEPSAPIGIGAASPLDDQGLRGELPGAGSWRVRGFVPADAAGWTARLDRAARAVEPPP